jgi:hypothetical protein
MTVRREAKEGQADARPQAPKNRRRIRWNTVRIFRGREQRRCPDIARRSRTVNVGQAPRRAISRGGAPQQGLRRNGATLLELPRLLGLYMPLTSRNIVPRREGVLARALILIW